MLMDRRHHAAGQRHSIHAAENLDLLHLIPAAAQNDASIGAEPRHIHGQHHRIRLVGAIAVGRRAIGGRVEAGAFRHRRAGLHRGFYIAESQERILFLFGEIAQDTGAVYRAIRAPNLLPLRYPAGRDQPRNYYLSGLHVGAVQRRNGDVAVNFPLLVERAAESSGRGGGISDEQEQRSGGGHYGFDGFVNFIAHALGFVDDDEHIGAVKALELAGAFGGQPQSVAVIGDFPPGIQHFAAQGRRRGAVKPAHLPPKDMAHLPESGRGAEGDGAILVRVNEPQHGDGGAKPFAQSVPGLNRHPAMLGQGFQDFHLLAPKLYAQDVPGESHRRRGCRPIGRGGRARGIGRRIRFSRRIPAPVSLGPSEDAAPAAAG